MAKVKKKTPSKIKYDAAHPIVSCRVSKEIYDGLKAVKKAEGKSPADILKIGLGIVEPRIKATEEATLQAWGKGYQKGYTDAMQLYKVTYPCIVCGETIEVTNNETKKEIGGYMKEHRWGHSECIDRKR